MIEIANFTIDILKRKNEKLKKQLGKAEKVLKKIEFHNLNFIGLKWIENYFKDKK